MVPAWLRPAPPVRTLIVAHLLVTAAVYTGTAFFPPHHFMPGPAWNAAMVLTGAQFALIACQCLLLASWWTLGLGSHLTRLTQTFALFLSLVGVHALGRLAVDRPAYHNSFVDAFIDQLLVKLAATAPTLALTVLTFAVFGALARRFGWRWQNDAPDLSQPTQFSIAQTLLLTLVCAAICGFVRWLQPDPDAWERWIEALQPEAATSLLLSFLHFFISFLAAGLIAVAAASGRRVRQFWLLLSVVAAAALGWAETTLLFSSVRELMPMIVGGTTLAAIFTLASLLWLRRAGWRIDWSSPSQAEKLLPLGSADS